MFQPIKRYELKTNLKIYIKDCTIATKGNRRISITVELNLSEPCKAVVIGINPSIANEIRSDKSLTKIGRYLYQYGIGEITMINLFETISVEQSGINRKQKCDFTQHQRLLEEADVIVVAWGIEDKYLTEKLNAFEYLMQYRDKVYCIQDKEGKKPRHPRRISYTDELVPFYRELSQKKYPVITLCGSTRFKKEFMEVQKRLTLEGNIVISVGLFGHAGDAEVWENMDEGTLTKTKEMLDDMHKRKIDMADEIFVINVGGYIGESTKSEIAYAKAHGKKVNYLE